MWGGTSWRDARDMIIDPQTFIVLEMDRHHAAAEAVRAFRQATHDAHREPSRRRRRGLVLRLASWVTGRTAHA